MAADDNKHLVRRLFDEVWNGRRFDLIDELYSPDFVVDYRPYAPLGHGRQAVRRIVDNLLGLRQAGVIPSPPSA